MSETNRLSEKAKPTPPSADVRLNVEWNSIAFFGIALTVLGAVGRLEPTWAKLASIGIAAIYVILGAVTLMPQWEWQRRLAGTAKNPRFILTSFSVPLWQAGFAGDLDKFPGPRTVWVYIHSLFVFFAVILVLEAMGVRWLSRITHSLVVARREEFFLPFVLYLGTASIGAWLFGEWVVGGHVWQLVSGVALIAAAFGIGLTHARIVERRKRLQLGK